MAADDGAALPLAEVGPHGATSVAEQRRAAILESMLDPHVFLEAVRGQGGAIVDFIYTDANAAAGDSMGMDSGQLVGSRLLDLLPGQAGSGMLALYADAVETGVPLVLDDYAYPHEILQDERHYDIRGIRVGDGLSLTWRDVTERRLQTDALAASEQRFRLLAENASDVVAQAAPDGTIEWMSESVTALLGWRREDMVGRRIFEYLHPDDVPAIAAAQPRLAHGEPLTFEARVRRADGDYRWVASHVRPVTDEAGAVTGRVAGWRDIHGQHLAVEALADSEDLFRTAMDNSAVGMCLVAPDGRFLKVNAALGQILARPPEVLMASTWQEITHPEDLDEDQALVDHILAGDRDSYRLRKRYLRPDGAIVWGDLSVACVRNSDGTVRNFVSLIIDVTDEVAVRQYLESVLDSAIDPHIMFTPVRDHDDLIIDLEYVDLNPAACDYLHTTREAIVGKRVLELYGRGASRNLLNWCAGAVDSDAAVVLDNQAMVSEVTQDSAWFDIRAVPLNGQVSFTFRVVTDRHEAKRRLEASEEKFRLLAENATDAVLHARDGIMVWLSPSLTEVLGWAPEDWVGHRFEEFTHPEDVALAQQRRDEINAGHTRITRLRLRDSQADFHWVEINAAPFEGRNGVPDGIAASFRTIDAQVRAETVLKDRARYDELTGLLNRAEVFDRLRTLLTQQPRTGREAAVAFCDLDAFKEINDTYGHQMGDHVLKTVAHDMRAQLRDDDLIARIGGDEILLVLTGVHDLDSAKAVAEKVRRDAAQTHHYLDIAYRPKLSIGVTLLRRGEEPDDVIARADRAMYAAKRGGGNQVIAT